MRIPKLALGLALACFAMLGGCATIPNPINQQQVYGLTNAYGIAQSVAVAYTALPRCAAGTHATATNYCSEHAIIVELDTADHKARIALTALENFVRDPSHYPGLSYAQLLETAQTAVTTLSQIEASNGVH